MSYHSFVIFYSMYIHCGRGLVFQLNNSVALVGSRNFGYSLCHAFEKSVVTAAAVDVYEVELPVLSVGSAVGQVPCYAVFVGVETVDASNLCECRVFSNPSHDLEAEIGGEMR